MFEPNSRYYNIETATYSATDGQLTAALRHIAYKRRRFLPRSEKMPLLVEVTVAEGDRLDLITYRTLGDPEAFWRVADANNVMNPNNLTSEPGAVIRVSVPTA